MAFCFAKGFSDRTGSRSFKLCPQARKLDTEVLAPMARWNTAFHTVEVRRFLSWHANMCCHCFARTSSSMSGCRQSLLLSRRLNVAPTQYHACAIKDPRNCICLHCEQMRMKKLEEIRLEVDSRRRTVQELTIKVRHSHM